MNATPSLSLNPPSVDGGAAAEILADRRPAPTPTSLASRSQQPIGIDRVGITLWTKPVHGRRVGLSEAVLNFARALG